FYFACTIFIKPYFLVLCLKGSILSFRSNIYQKFNCFTVSNKSEKDILKIYLKRHNSSTISIVLRKEMKCKLLQFLFKLSLPRNRTVTCNRIYYGIILYGAFIHHLYNKNCSIN